MIRANPLEEPENKENIQQKSKSSLSFPTQRCFGTDLTKPISQSSQQSSNDPQLLDYYSEEIYEYLKSIESHHKAKYGYMKQQTDISEKMRSVLIDWLVEVHFRFKLASETLFLAVNIIDRYLEKTPICRSRLQLIGVSALLIASKYEDIYPPETRDLVYITDKAYTKEEILQTEAVILKVLEYNITVPSAFRFLERYSRLAGCCEQQFALASYLQELALIDYNMLKYPNSMNAAASLYLMFKIKEVKPEWTEELKKASGYLEEQIKPCAKEMCLLFQNASRSSLKGVKTKFSSAQYFHVANTTLL
ncbi:hypothetical protein SteCoe_11384 [Stentor coeruleus]|uniref:Uncharacterized protein n=1 Tax=Stentor coeruleus TaxID=5963 RepID=A0A1R2CDD0_9CILI|nr:hypothetical protein SteCoe_11384 [Stentor coeruleus]